jgi:hypothetical protein
MTMYDDHTHRYLETTRAHQTLTEIARAAHYVNHYLNETIVMEDEGDGEVTPRDALAAFRDRTGAVAVGAAEPANPRQWDREYDRRLRAKLACAADYADQVAAGARAVIAALDSGLITAPRTWTVDEINDGTMSAYLSDIAATGSDAAALWGCMSALTEARGSQAINHAVYDRHMAHIDKLWAASVDERQERPGRFPILAEPADDAEHVAGVLATWRGRYDAANNALAEPMPYLRAVQLINGCETFDRLAHYAEALTGPAWGEDVELPWTPETHDDASQVADRLMMALAHRVK